ncbi:pyridoxamine 5'-phosphate oxidase family protein, partial [Polaribacter sp.]|nr:pyridoxamine 5'-phosphate oxidase family protein [Polaribacter sp.]
EKAPNVLRLYGKGTEIKEGDKNWNELIQIFPETPGTRQIFDISVESAQTSCGMSIPFFEYKGEREDLNNWADKKGKEGIKKYWQEKNLTSIDGLPTDIL